MTGAPWWEGPLLGFDVETTGPDPESARIVTACAVLTIPASVAWSRPWLVNPGVDIPEAATAIHGVSTEQARDLGQPAAGAVSEIIDTLTRAAVPLVAFNAAFDFTVLDREARRYGLTPLIPDPVIDPFVLDKQVDRFRRGSRKLVDVAQVWGVELRDAHTADADALAAVEVARAIGRHEPHPPVNARALHAGQVAWRAEQCASLQDYFRRTKDPDAVVAREWPVLPLPVGVAS